MTVVSGFYAGQVGAQVRLDTLLDTSILAAATKAEIWCKEPYSSTVKTWAATILGTELVFTTTAITDLPSEGEYVLEPYIEAPGYKIPGDKVVMKVGQPLKDVT